MRRANPVDDRRLRLDRVGWPGRLKPGSLARLGLVTALLLTAAGVLYSGGPEASCVPGPVPRASPHRDGPGPGGYCERPAGPGHPSGPARDDGLPHDPGSGAASTVPPGSDGAGGSTAEGRARPRLAMPPGTVGVVVALADPATLGVLRAGDRVDLLASAPHGPPSTSVLAAGVMVLATPDLERTGGGLYLALRPDQAHAVVAQPPGARFAVLVRP